MRQTPDGLEQRLLSRARAAGLVAGDRLVLAFSGGRDSLVLAAAMRWVQSALGIEALLVHVDHQLRPASAVEAERAIALADALGMPARLVVVPGPVQLAHPGVGIEEAARRGRYRLLGEEALVIGARAVATAHHLEDQAETVMLHLLRGGGVHGAAGMAERSPLPTGRPSDISQEGVPWLWRPFLSEPREVIDAYVARLGLAPIEDPTNQDASFRRNALRHEILPMMEAHFPGAKAALARFAALAAEDDRLLAELAASELTAVIDDDGALVAARLRALPLAMQRRVVRAWLAQQLPLQLLSAQRTDAVLGLVWQDAAAIIEIGEGWTVRRERGKLRAAQHGNGGEGRGR